MGRVLRDEILAQKLAGAANADEFEKILNHYGVALTVNQRQAVVTNLDMLKAAAATLDMGPMIKARIS